jgi:hypothetical protein
MSRERFPSQENEFTKLFQGRERLQVRLRYQIPLATHQRAPQQQGQYNIVQGPGSTTNIIDNAAQSVTAYSSPTNVDTAYIARYTAS